MLFPMVEYVYVLSTNTENLWHGNLIHKTCVVFLATARKPFWIESYTIYAGVPGD